MIPLQVRLHVGLKAFCFHDISRSKNGLPIFILREDLSPVGGGCWFRGDTLLGFVGTNAVILDYIAEDDCVLLVKVIMHEGRNFCFSTEPCPKDFGQNFIIPCEQCSRHGADTGRSVFYFRTRTIHK